MKLSDLLCGIDHSLLGVSPDTEISVPVSDSRLACRNCLFLCIDGTKRNGKGYIKEAVSRGAAACVCEEPVKGVPSVTVSDVRSALSAVWNNFYGSPAKNMRLYGITGTNGKTSTSYFLKSILEASGRKTGLIGTSGCFAGDEEIELPGSEVSDYPAAMTTPDPGYLYRALAIMKERGVTDTVIEVSSHGIYHKRISALDFFCGVFTNLTPEHLDLHGDMETYFSVKKSFLDNCQIKIYNRDDKYGRRFYPMLYSYGITDTENVRRCGDETAYVLKCGREKIRITSCIPGDFTLYNTMAAAKCAAAAGICAAHIANGIGKVKSIPGRMEKVVSEDVAGFSVIIDFAHTPAAFENVLKSLKKTNAEKLTVLFGCGGDRDPAKRAPMGEIAARYADRIIVTDDNPRWEDHLKIIEDILKGIPKGKNVTVIPSRRDAVIYALETAKAGETVLLCGKGQENCEIIKGKKIPFSEKQIIAGFLRERYGK